MKKSVSYMFGIYKIVQPMHAQIYKYNPKQKIRKKMKKYLLWLLLVIVASSYAIQGNWKLTDIQQSQLTDSQNIRVQIKDFIYRNTTIRWVLTFLGCKSYKYMMDIESRNMYIDINTMYASGDDDKKCIAQQSGIQKRIQDMIKKVFTFQIMSSYMIFSDPEGRVLFKFQRIVPVSEAASISGAWMANTLNSNKISQIVEISESNITFCQRAATLEYKISGKNKIEIGVFKNNGCSNTQLINAIRKAMYFVKRSTTLELYDQDDNLLISVVYMMDLQTANKQREEQQRQQEILRQQQQQQQYNQVRMQPQPPQNLPMFNGPRLTNTISDLIGKWTIAKIFNMASYATGVDFVISNGTILISTKCNTYILTYSTASSNPVKIKRQNFRAVQGDPQCIDGDDGLYKTALSKVLSFNVKVENQKYIVSIQDEKNQEVFQIEKPAQGQFMVQSPPPQVPPPQFPPFSIPNPNAYQPNQYSPPFPGPAPSPFPAPTLYNPNQIQPGRYTVLLLRRRDIARKIIMIDNNSFTIKLCNQLKISYTTSPTNSIKFTVTKKSSNSCDTTQQNLFIDFFSKIESFYKQGQDVYLKDSKGEQLITLNNV